MTRPVQPENHSISHLIESLATVKTELQELEGRLQQQFAETRQQEIKQAEEEVEGKDEEPAMPMPPGRTTSEE